jgi:hypothetical protein
MNEVYEHEDIEKKQIVYELRIDLGFYRGQKDVKVVEGRSDLDAYKNAVALNERHVKESVNRKG